MKDGHGIRQTRRDDYSNLRIVTYMTCRYFTTAVHALCKERVASAAPAGAGAAMIIYEERLAERRFTSSKKQGEEH